MSFDGNIETAYRKFRFQPSMLKRAIKEALKDAEHTDTEISEIINIVIDEWFPDKIQTVHISSLFTLQI